MYSLLQTAAPAGPLPINDLLFVVVPYVVLAVFFSMTIWRYVKEKFSYSSYSSQFLENQHQFWGSVPWHYGILALVAGHLIGFLVPRGVLWWNSVPARLYIIEGAALIFGIITLIGLINLIVRRASNPRVRAVTSKMDVVVLVLLLLQVIGGLWVALTARWGSSWFAAVLAPYLWSLFTFQPDASAVAQLPWSIKLHILGAYAIFALFPFTRLVHVLVVPNHYLWRRFQVVMWNKRASKAE
ncbi:MAG: Respiratory nitrate reductase 2 gamma chain [Planctomycetes bacterium]|nr:Respiratory nitrate reductase 2 gamma chain [Planctomycetota bacterium]HRJ77613.1 respiratory nitrate reductase subunit gamma [Planctomycetota bacterium]